MAESRQELWESSDFKSAIFSTAEFKKKKKKGSPVTLFICLSLMSTGTVTYGAHRSGILGPMLVHVQMLGKKFFPNSVTGTLPGGDSS